jgi:hypothetical protein
MRFSPDIDAAPRNVALLLDHSEYGVGIGVIQRHEYDGHPPHDSVQFAYVSDRRLGSAPPGVSMPSPVKVEELSGWCALDALTSEVAWVTEADKRVLKLEKAITDARDRLTVLNLYADTETVIEGAGALADDLNKALEIA